MARRKKVVPDAVRGHRGVAARSIKKPQLESYAERLSQGRHEIPADEVAKFLNDEYVIDVHSSNVANVQFFRDDHTMIVQFLSGARYLYKNISWGEALDFALAQSKGSWCWQHLRIRGTKNGHRKPYERLS